jgi:hypothetical protein
MLNARSAGGFLLLATVLAILWLRATWSWLI